MSTNSSASRVNCDLPMPGAFPRASAWPGGPIDGANGARGGAGARVAVAIWRPTPGTSPFPGQVLAQPKHVYTDKTRMAAGKRDVTGSQPWRAPV